MKCNYYRYGMTNCLMIFGNIRRQLLFSFVCIKLLRRQNGQYLLSCCVTSARWKWPINEAILMLFQLKQRREGNRFSLNVKCSRYKHKRRTSKQEKGMRNGEINEGHQLVAIGIAFLLRQTHRSFPLNLTHILLNILQYIYHCSLIVCLKDNWIIAIAIGDNDNTLASYYTS